MVVWAEQRRRSKRCFIGIFYYEDKPSFLPVPGSSGIPACWNAVSRSTGAHSKRANHAEPSLLFGLLEPGTRCVLGWRWGTSAEGLASLQTQQPGCPPLLNTEPASHPRQRGPVFPSVGGSQTDTARITPASRARPERDLCSQSATLLFAG